MSSQSLDTSPPSGTRPHNPRTGAEGKANCRADITHTDDKHSHGHKVDPLARRDLSTSVVVVHLVYMCCSTFMKVVLNGGSDGALSKQFWQLLSEQAYLSLSWAGWHLPMSTAVPMHGNGRTKSPGYFLCPFEHLSHYHNQTTVMVVQWCDIGNALLRIPWMSPLMRTLCICIINCVQNNSEASVTRCRPEEPLNTLKRDGL